MPMQIGRRSTLGFAATLALPSLGRAQVLPLLKIGVLTDLSGAYRDNSGPTSVLAARQAVEDFKPEARGFRVEILAADHQQKPDIGGAVARQWFDRDGVDAIADVNNTAIALAVRTQALEKDKALLISGAASADLTGKWCSPNSVHWAPDTYGDSRSTGNALLRGGGKKWYLLVADYVFGHALEADTTALIKAGGGEVVGITRYPFPGTSDFSSFLLQASASGADVLAVCATGGDMENGVKQAAEFGLARRGLRVAPMFGFVTEIKALGLPVAQGIYLTEPFYWDLNERTRAFTRRFLPKAGDNYPSSLHAGAYSVTTHYMKAAAEIGVEKMRSGKAAIAAMKAMPTDDDCFGRASIRADGRFLADTHLFQVKTPAESTAPWDLLKPMSSTPGAEAYRPMAEGACAMVKS
ncbi:MAG: ABC transporter substrate-binding protein [Janthinobacterium lividum]